MGTPVAQAAACTAPSHQITHSPRPHQDVHREVLKETKCLECEDEHVLLKATATLVMLATVPEALPHLSQAVPRLVTLLHEGLSLQVKKNVCAALSSIMNASETLYICVIRQPRLIEGLLLCLQSGKASEDEAIQINAAAALNIMGQREEGLDKMLERAAEDELVSILSSSGDGNLLEEAVDGICALASHEKARDILVHKGVVTQLARLIGNSSPEICVRALLALGMLCGSSPSAQLILAKAEGAVEALLMLTRSEDADVQGISRDLFKMITMNENTRLVVERALRTC